MTLYEDLKEGLTEAIAYENGEITAETVTVATEEGKKKEASE